MSETFDVGDGIRAEARFAVAGVLTDPTAVAVEVRDPAGTVTTPTPVHDGVGEYSLDLVPDASGVWVVRFTATGAVTAVVEQAYQVRPEGIEGLGIASYGGSPATVEADRLRLLVGDTGPSFVLSDPEVAAFVAVDADLRVGASQAALAMSARFAAQVDRTVGDVSVSLSQKAKAYSTLARDLTSSASSASSSAVLPIPFAGGLRYSQVATRDPDIIPTFGEVESRWSLVVDDRAGAL